MIAHISNSTLALLEHMPYCNQTIIQTLKKKILQIEMKSQTNITKILNLRPRMKLRSCDGEGQNWVIDFPLRFRMTWVSGAWFGMGFKRVSSCS